jgi:MFS family permease
MTRTDSPATPERYAPFSALALGLPYGVATGYSTTTLVYLLSHNGATVQDVANLAALAILPNTWKVLWAPLMDVTLSARLWFGLSIAVTAAAYAGCAFTPANAAHLNAFDWLVLILNIAVSVSYITAARIIAYITPQHRQGAVGGWLNAGNVGGMGLGGGLGLLIATHVANHPWASAGALGLLTLACGAPLAWLPMPKRDSGAGSLRGAILDLAREAWSLLGTRAGLLALFLSLMPLGSGALGNLWSSISDDWHAGPDTVALVNGILGSLLSIPGCLAGGWVCDRMDRKKAYILAGLMMSACALAMFALPRTETMFILWTSAYGVTVGFSYVAFTAYVLEVIGRGAAAMKYTMLAAVSNVPILVATQIDGQAHAPWGSGGMLLTDAALGVAGAALYLAVAWLATRRRPALA